MRQNTVFLACRIGPVGPSNEPVALPVNAQLAIGIDYVRDVDDPTLHPPVTVRYTGYDAVGTLIPMSNGNRLATTTIRA